MWNPLTNGVPTTRDIVWLQCMCYSKDIGYNVVVEPLVLNDNMLVYRREGRMEMKSLTAVRQLQWTTFSRWRT
jgi:hypothetical protein